MCSSCSDRFSPKASIIIPVHNNLHLTKTCLERIRQNSSEVDYEVIVIDNASTDGTREFLRSEQELGKLRAIFSDTNLGFAKACNLGAREALGKYVVFLNNDTEPLEGWLVALVSTAEKDERIAAVGAKLLFPDGTIQHAGIAIGKDLSAPIVPFHIYFRERADAPYVNREKDLQVVTGACMLVRRDVFLAFGGFDEAFKNGYEDVDFCLRLKEAGYRVVYTPKAEVIHLESQTPGRFDAVHENVALLHRKWLEKVRFDYEEILRQDRIIVQPERTRSAERRQESAFIVVARNDIETVGGCMRQLPIWDGDEVILVDVGSTDMTREYLQIWAEEHPGTKLILLDENAGFSGAIREGLRACSKDTAIVLEADVYGPPGWEVRLLRHVEKEVVVGPLCVEPGLSTQRYELYAGPAISKEGQETLRDLAGILAARNEGRLVRTQSLGTFCMVGRTVELLEAMETVPTGLCSRCAGAAISWALRERGKLMFLATDTLVARSTRALNEETEHHTCAELLIPLFASRYGQGNVPPLDELLNAGWIEVEENQKQVFRDRSKVLPITSIVIPVRRGLEFLRACIRSVLANTPDPFELIIVDDASDDLIRMYLETLASTSERVRVIRSDVHLGFPGACNLGIEASRGEAILFLNNDTVVTEGWLWRLHRCLASEPDVGIAGAVSNYAPGPQFVENCTYRTIEELTEFARKRAAEYCGMYMDVQWVTGMCMLVRREVVDRIGGFDPAFSPGNFEDDDFCLRARLAGFRVKVALDTFIHHEGSRTFKEEEIDYKSLIGRNFHLFLHKWGLPEHIRMEELYDHIEWITAVTAFNPEKHYVPLRSMATAAAGRWGAGEDFAVHDCEK
ncbi:MAG: glycosyltransferase [Armatimonadota bacterium]|nr:glycosyltransferase [Armatimonadota bacterium]